jgi:hypothetical protein
MAEIKSGSVADLTPESVADSARDPQALPGQRSPACALAPTLRNSAPGPPTR